MGTLGESRRRVTSEGYSTRLVPRRTHAGRRRRSSHRSRPGVTLAASSTSSTSIPGIEPCLPSTTVWRPPGRRTESGSPSEGSATLTASATSTSSAPTVRRGRRPNRGTSRTTLTSTGTRPGRRMGDGSTSRVPAAARSTCGRSDSIRRRVNPSAIRDPSSCHPATCTATRCPPTGAG